MVKLTLLVFSTLKLSSAGPFSHFFSSVQSCFSLDNFLSKGIDDAETKDLNNEQDSTERGTKQLDRFYLDMCSNVDAIHPN